MTVPGVEKPVEVGLIYDVAYKVFDGKSKDIFQSKEVDKYGRGLEGRLIQLILSLRIWHKKLIGLIKQYYTP